MNFSFFLNWRGSRWEILKGWFGRLGQHWGWEFNFYATHSFILVDIRLQPQGDHRGVFVMLGLLGIAVDVNIYDSRHGDQL
jgi:hypothetical protein